uniref:Uncharacterized protein n=1 Tax=Odontella aurita TaxID=265563 RepID=A0A7S4JIM1_9STRA
MFDVSWGETAVLFGAGFFLVGRRDLPHASRIFGTQVGRIVGLLRGARARADRFTANNELRHLQNELRSGLRELDQVKSELAVAASSGGLIGRGLGKTTSGANRGLRTELGAPLAASAAARASPTTTATPRPAVAPTSVETGSTVANAIASSPSIGGEDYLAAARAAADALPPSGISASPSSNGTSDWKPTLELAPRSHAVAAVAEEEWEKQGIGFRSRAEKGTGIWDNASAASAGDQGAAGMTGGASLVSDLIQQSLIYDQYDRAVREQDEAMDRRAERIREDRQRGKN